MIYTFKCIEHGKYEVNQKMCETQHTHICPICQQVTQKVIMVTNFNCPSAAGKKPKVIDTKVDWITRQNRDRWI